MSDTTRAILQIVMFYLFFYAALRFMEGTRGAGIFRGLVVFIVVAFVGLSWLTEQLNLDVVAYVLKNWILSALVIGTIVLFQPELRKAFVRLGQNPILLTFFKGQSHVVKTLVTTATRLSAKKIGAIIAVEREGGLGSYLESGTRLDAELSVELLEAIFYPGNPLHDAGVIIQHERVAAAGCLFPLTENPDLDRSIGTRHRAAIGLSEESDAIVIVVSEQTGNLSIGIGGKLHTQLDAATMEKMLTDLYVTQRQQGGEAASAAG